MSEEEGVKFSPYLYVCGRKRMDCGLGLDTFSVVHELTNSDQKQKSICYRNVKGVWFTRLSSQKVITNNCNFSLQAQQLHITDLPDLTRIKWQSTNNFLLPMLIFFIIVSVLLGPSEPLICQRSLQVFNFTVAQLSNSWPYESPLGHIHSAIELKTNMTCSTEITGALIKLQYSPS